jgi:hypothetical protein
MHDFSMLSNGRHWVTKQKVRGAPGGPPILDSVSEPAGHDMTCIISLSIPARSLCRCSKSSLVPSSPTEIKAGGTRTRFGSYSCYAKQSTRREGFVRRAGAGRSYSAPGASHKQLARPRATAAALATAGKATKDTVQQPRKRTAYTSTPSNSSRPIETRVRRAY